MKLALGKPEPIAPLTRRSVGAAPAHAGRHGAGSVEHDPFARAERLFGAPAHLVLVSDARPALSFSGWTLGSARAESTDHATGTRRDVDVDVMFSERGDYVIAERIATRVADGALRLSARVADFRSPRELRIHCEAPSLDPQTDAARAAAVDHAARRWPWLQTGRRTHTGPTILPFSL